MRRTLTVLTLLAALMPLTAGAQQGSGRTKQDAEIMNYRLTMEKLRKLVEVQRSLNAADKKNPQLFEAMDGDMQASSKKNGPLTASEKAAIIDRNPEAKRVFTSAGWSSHEWLLTTEAMGNAYLSIAARDGTVEAPPPATDAQRANVALLEKNDAEFKKIMAELDRLSDELLQ